MKLITSIKGKLERFFTTAEEVHVHLDTDDMKLISTEKFVTEFGIGTREVYKDGKYTLEVTTISPDDLHEQMETYRKHYDKL